MLIVEVDMPVATDLVSDHYQSLTMRSLIVNPTHYIASKTPNTGKIDDTYKRIKRDFTRKHRCAVLFIITNEAFTTHLKVLCYA